jgi:hypothetical protein
MPTYQTEAFCCSLTIIAKQADCPVLTHNKANYLIAKGLKRKNNPWAYALDRLNR